jgi:uncharacterized protein (UPF0332 family)
MPVSPDDFLNSADALIKDGSEIGERNAISRAYYATYHEVRSLSTSLPGANLVSDGVGVHEHLIWRLISARQIDATFKHSNATMAIGYVLRQMKTLRVCADYDLAWKPDNYEAASQISIAKKTKEKIQALATSLGSAS